MGVTGKLVAFVVSLVGLLLFHVVIISGENAWPVRSRPGDQFGGATRRTTEPEKTDGSARGSWG
jgi:hypothetical protein